MYLVRILPNKMIFNSLSNRKLRIYVDIFYEPKKFAINGLYYIKVFYLYFMYILFLLTMTSTNKE